jgi:hypothetical protein
MGKSAKCASRPRTATRSPWSPRRRTLAAQCRKTLEATRAAPLRNADALREKLPPCDFDNYLPIAKAAWHNLGLCSR